MTSMCKVCRVLAAMALAALALPSFADNGKKLYGLQMQIVSAVSPFTVSATITNEGNSTIHSFLLSVSGLSITNIVTPPLTGDATITGMGSSLTVTNLHPLKSGDSVEVVLGVNTCGDGKWSASVWNGSSLNGQSFALGKQPASDLATSTLCGMVGIGDTFTVPNALDPTPTCGVSGMRGYYDEDGSIPTASLPFYVTNTIPINGELHFRWPVDNMGDPLATFEYTICAAGALPAPGVAQVAWLNTDGSLASSPGTPAFITAQDCLLSPPQNPAYPLPILPAPYGTLIGNGTPSVTTANGIPDTTGTQIVVNALSPNPTGPNGSIRHADAHPPFDTFDIVIGTERMTVTNVASDDGDGGDLSDTCDYEACTPGGSAESETELETWTVIRGVGNTTAASHATGVLVMSTPLPLVTVVPQTNPPNPPSPYHLNDQALVCIANETESPAGCTASDPTCTHSTTFFDIGDAWVNHP